MLQRLLALVQAFFQRFAAIDPTQKIVVGTVLLAMVLGGGFLFRQASNDFDVLYSNLSLPDAAATVAKLKELNTPYRLADGGTTVLVPRTQKNQLVLDTADELTGNEPISLTKIPPVLQGEVQKEWLKKFNSDTISATLESIQGIRDARVIIAQPEDSVFRSSQDPVQASVMLVVEPGFRLKEAQVKTIKNLVAHAVPGLKPASVAISDNFGNSLEQALSAGGILSDSESRRRTFEQETQAKIQNLLTPLVGQDNAVVAVSAEFNFDRARAKIHNVLPTAEGTEGPGSGLIVSQQSQSESYAGGPNSGPGGQAGISSNASPSYQGSKAEEDSDKKAYSSNKSTTNYVHSEEDREVIYHSGKLERLSIAVVLNKVLTEAEEQELKDMIVGASALNFERGDTLDVRGFQFSQAPGQQVAELNASYAEAQQQDFWLQLAYLGGMVLLGLAGLLVFYNLLKRPLQGELVDEDLDEEVALDEQGNEILIKRQGAGQVVIVRNHDNAPLEYQTEGNGPMRIELAENPVGKLKGLPEIDSVKNAEIEYMKESINSTIMANPEEAARVLVSFMKDAD